MLQEKQISRLNELKQLLDSGVLSEEEFAAEKAKIMSEAEKAPSLTLDGIISYLQQHKALLFQILFLLASIITLCIDDDDISCLLSIAFAVVAIILSWVKNGRVSKKYSILSTIVAVIVAACAVIELIDYF